MTEETKKNLSRRDALKILGAAAGATVLANLPAKWNTPELAAGVLPAHAQTSEACVVGLTVEVLSTDDTGAHFGWSTAVDVVFWDWDGTAGSMLQFACTDICLGLQTYLTSGTTATYRFTTISQQFTVPADTEILINMATGEYALNGATPPTGCDWGAVAPSARSTFSSESK